MRKSDTTVTEQLIEKIPVYFKLHLSISTIHLQWIPLLLLHLHIPRSIRSITLPNPTNIFIIKSRKQTEWLRSWTDGNWGSSPPSYLPAVITTATQGLLWTDPALPVEGPGPNPRMQLCSPPHRISGIQQQLPTALVDGHLSYTTAIPPKHSNKTGGICLLAKPTQEVPS